MQSIEKNRIFRLIEKGVTIPNPAAIDIGDEVDLDRISGDGIIIYSGCKIYGKHTLIMAGARLGYEAPVTIDDCWIGPRVELKGGFFTKSVFLERSNMGSCAQVREACILEEEANGAHAVGLKHTILLPFVTLGSLINFCDCLMAGGTSRKNHSEVGSSYIHFNYTPNQDKATASIIGDVPRGVMLDQPPIFLGGQGGLVGPARVDFGSVIAAGTVFRQDCCEGGKLIASGGGLERKRADFYPGLYSNIKRRVVNNINYIANLIALRWWYVEVRSQFLDAELYKGALDTVDCAIDERIKRFKALVQKLPASVEIYRRVMKENAHSQVIMQKEEIHAQWQGIEDIFARFREGRKDSPELSSLLEEVARKRGEKGNDYIAAIKGLDSSWRYKGTSWLRGIAEGIIKEVLQKIPSYQ